jgi:nicotinate phosphoribosyltransferase
MEYLRGQKDRTGSRVFADDFLAWLRHNAPATFDSISLQALPEGRVVHPHVPLTVVQRPLPDTPMYPI